MHGSGTSKYSPREGMPSALARNNQGSRQEWGAAIPILRGVFGRQEGRQTCVHQVTFTSRSVVLLEVVQYARVGEVSLCRILLVVATVACLFQRWFEPGVGVSINTNSDRILACVDGNVVSRSSELGRLIIISYLIHHLKYFCST